jgi:hypothetical protein
MYMFTIHTGEEIGTVKEKGWGVKGKGWGNDRGEEECGWKRKNGRVGYTLIL